MTKEIIEAFLPIVNSIGWTFIWCFFIVGLTRVLHVFIAMK